MLLDNIPAGKNVPEDINVVIEIPAQGAPVKYEIDKDSGALVVDRFMATAMFYPCNYGFIPHTLSDDGDPVDHVQEVTDLPELLRAQIAHFFEQYKALEKGKWVKVDGWADAAAARAEIVASVERLQASMAD
jgi:inorganic pyrophosphatase